MDENTTHNADCPVAYETAEGPTYNGSLKVFGYCEHEILVSVSYDSIL